MNDREWEDHLMGNTMSPYPRVQDSIRIQQGLNSPSPPYISRRGGGPSEPGLIATYFEWLAEKSEQISEKVPPFKQLIVASEWLGKRGWKINVAFGAVGALLAASFMFGQHEAGSLSAGFARWSRGLFGVHLSWISLLTGFAAGSFALPFAGELMKFCIRAFLWLLLFAVTLFVIWGVYAIAALFLDWPIPFV